MDNDSGQVDVSEEAAAAQASQAPSAGMIRIRNAPHKEIQGLALSNGRISEHWQQRPSSESVKPAGACAMIARPARGPNSDKGPAQAHDASRNSQHDHPLSCHWRPVAPDALDFLGLSPLRSKLATIARTQILTEAFVIGRADPNAWISYSRAKMFYTSRAGHRYWPTTYSYRTIVPTIDQSSAKGRLDHGWQSRFKASPELLRRLSEPPLAVVHDPRKLIVLRDHDGNVIDYTDTRRTDRMRRNIQSINEAIMGAAIELRGRAIRDGDPLQVGNANVVANITERYAKSKKPNDFKAAVTEGRESKSPPPRRRGRVG